MMVLRVLLILLISLPCFADIDTYDGASITTSSIRDGVTLGTIDGVDIAGSGGCSGTYGFDAGANIDNVNANLILCVRVPLNCSGTISSLEFYAAFIDNSTREVEFALYEDNGSGTDPGDLINQYGAFFDSGIGGTPGWAVDSTVSETIAGDPAYVWVAVGFEADTSRFYYGSSSSEESREASSTFGTFPDPWPTGTDTEYTRDYSVRINFP